MKPLLPVKVKARVVTGAGRGKKLGIPTINFDPLAVRNLREGIYVCRVIFSSSLAYWGVLHYGPRPTFGEASVSLEVYLLDFSDDESVVPLELEVEIYFYIREIMNFKNPQEMVRKIGRDVAVAKGRIKSLVYGQIIT